MLMCRFSAWFGNNSTSGKQRRLLGELHTRMSACGHFSADRTGLRTEYLPTLRQALTKPLVEQEKEGIPPVVALMQVWFQVIYIIVKAMTKPLVEQGKKGIPAVVTLMQVCTKIT